MKRALVLGGAGFLGSSVAARFASMGWVVTVIDPMREYGGANPFNVQPAAGCDFICADVADVANLPGRIADSDVVIDAMGSSAHVWAYNHPVADLADNVASHLALLDAFRAAPARPPVVYLSSRAVYGRPETTVVTEEAECIPIDLQGVNKFAAERHFELLGQRYGLRVATLRLSNCYGPRQRLTGSDVGLVGGMLRAAFRNESISVYGSLDRTRDMLFVGDFVDAVVAIVGAREFPTGVMNLGGSCVRLGEISQRIVECVGGGNVVVEPFPPEVSRIDPGEIMLDCALIRARTGWSPTTSFEDGIQRTVAFYRSFGEHFGIEA